jgi:DNA modification methylase
VPCIRLAHLSEAQKRAYILADNRLAELGGGWDSEMLKLELADLGELDVDLEGIGFGVDDLADMDLDMGDGEGNPEADAEPQIDKAEELREKWGVETGQLWQLGDHRILCGDSTKAEDVARVMGGEKCDAVLTDPPYGIGDLMHGGTWARKQDVQFEKMRDWDAKTEQFFFDSIISLSVPSIVWGGNYFATPPSRCWLVWDKPEFPTMSSAELAWTNLDKNTKRIECPRAHQADGAKDHATQKPIAVMTWCLGFLPDGIIYEPFSGSGTTIIACEQLKRKCRAIEISPAYVAVAIQRWVDATGKEPKLLK